MNNFFILHFDYGKFLQINAKLGGTNHSLTSRLPTGGPSQPRVFQDPPCSISWLFDKPTMLMGMDVSHAEKGSESKSVAAVVGSMVLIILIV